jgi:zinc transporter 1/2/3
MTQGEKTMGYGAKFLVSLIILCIALIFGLFPILIRANDLTKKILSYGESFAGGIFLGAGLIHLLPDAQNGLHTVFNSTYPLAFVICAFTILALRMIEEGTIKLLVCHNEACKHPHLQPWLAYLLAILLSIHSVIAGIALGVETALSTFIIIFIAIIAHKGSAAFALGVSMRKQGLTKNIMLQLMLLFSLMTPIGIIFGSFFAHCLAANSGQFISGIFNAIAAGTFIYIAFHIVDTKETEECVPVLLRLAYFALGLMVMTAIALYM